MTYRNLLIVVSTLSSALLSGCGTQSREPENGAKAHAAPPAGPHYYYKKGQAPARAMPGSVQRTDVSAQLTYRGGPVISNINIIPIYWGTGARFQSDINQFYSDISNSSFFDWLNEYNTPSQSIGRGQAQPGFVDTAMPGGRNPADSDVANEIANLIANGSIPPADGNTYYPVHFALGDGPDGSCTSYCAYHNSATINGTTFYYGIIPDCDGGCSQTGVPIDAITATATHEMTETVTDPDVGNNNLAWYDDTNGEIGDICNDFEARFGNWQIQLEWSNAHNACWPQ
jgi:hypothetical protein